MDESVAGPEGPTTLTARPIRTAAEATREEPVPSTWLRGHLGQLVVALVVLANAWTLRATTDAVTYLDDASIHEQMARFAATSVGSWQVPALRWFPFLNLGSPQFLHYQGLGATLTGGVGLIFGADTAFRWSLYLMLVLWPVAIYWSARIMRLPVLAAAGAAALSPFLMSTPSVGYEQGAYLWIGYGLWAQLCASWALPFAWAWTWRALQERRYVIHAAIFVTLTAALHFETGYMAFTAVVLLPFMVPSDLRRRLCNGVVILAGGLMGTLWVTLPLLLQANWAALNTALAQTGLVRGYGARQDLGWLFSGNTFDHNRLPVVTIAVFLGLVMSIVNWRKSPLGRGLAVLFTVILLMSFGPTTWGRLVVILPGHADLYFRRFLMGVHLSGIYLAGTGLYWVGQGLARLLARLARPADEASLPSEDEGRPRWPTLLTPVVTTVVMVLFLVPAVIQLWNYDAANAADIGYQRNAEAADAAQINPLLNYVKQQNDGRLYAGSPNDWGTDFTVGYVPVFKYVESRDIDEVGYTLRTASLMEQPENNFNDTNLSDYQLFGVRYVLLPGNVAPRSFMVPVRSDGNFHLYVIPSVHYLDPVALDGTVTYNRADVGPASVWLLNSNLVARHLDPQVLWRSGTNWTVSATRSAPSQATITDVTNHLSNGGVAGTLRARTTTTVLLSASYDPGWHATIDGQPAPTIILAPALVGVTVPSGVHRVVFQYQGFTWIIVLFFVSCLSLALVATWSRWGRGRRDPEEPTDHASSWGTV